MCSDRKHNSIILPKTLLYVLYWELKNATYYTRYSPCNPSRTASSTYYKKALMIFIGFGMVNNYRTLPPPRSSDLVLLLPRLVPRMSTSTMREKRARTWWRRPRTKVPNNKNLPKNYMINSGKWLVMIMLETIWHVLNMQRSQSTETKMMQISWNRFGKIREITSGELIFGGF